MLRVQVVAIVAVHLIGVACTGPSLDEIDVFVTRAMEDHQEEML